MATYIEYKLDDGGTILVEIPGQEGGIVKASNKEGHVVKGAEKKFSEALDSIKSAATAMRQKLSDLKADEVEVKFGLKATGELGNFAIAKTGVEANYEVTLKWKNEK